ncbi:MAG TPA: ABC transporter permease [Acidobacteriaceae bacterium]|jgi:predicted permease|nr:ABC transporter permease [Acidobacteriaceae bacterium]
MNWFRQIFTRGRRYDELSESIREHLDEKIADLMDGGMTRKEAETAARREFGNVTRIEERSREVWQWTRLRNFWADVRFALRQFGKRPGFALVCVLTIALGVGANTAVFSVVDAVMLRPLPYMQSQRLVEVEMMSSRHDYERSDVSYPDFFDWRTQNKSFSQLVSYHDTSFALTGAERAVRVDGEVTSWNLLPLLGMQPELGRGFLPQEEKEGSRVVLISHALWVSRFASDPSVVGRTIPLSGEPFTVIGVMPPSFRFPVSAPQNSIWTTSAVDDNPSDPDNAISNRGMRWMNVLGRLKPGVKPAQANQDLDVIAARLAKQFPHTNARNSSTRVESELTAVLGPTGTLLKIVLSAVLLVLLVACGNIANLLLARVRERERELAMRAALGAGRGRIVRQLLVESTMLGFVGGVAGCGLAFAAVPVLLRLIGDNVPRAADAGVNLPVLAFAFAISLLSGIIFGVLPAWTASRRDPVSILKEGGYTHVSGRDWLRSTVIVGQVALGIVLTAGAGLLISSYAKLTHADEGFHSDHLLTFNFDLPDARYKDTRPAFYREYFDRLRALPGVTSAAGSMFLPMTDNDMNSNFEDPEHPVPPGQRPAAKIVLISGEYFHTMQIPLLRGRDFAEADDGKAPQVMIVNHAFVQKYFAGNDVLGKKLRTDSIRQIVGVVGDTRQSAMQELAPPIMYLPASQLPRWCCLTSVVRASVDPLSLEPSVQHLVSSMNPELPITDVRTMRDLIGLQLGLPRLATILLGTFAGLALALTIVGLYGVMTYSVMQRTRDIGVRLALGAQRGSILTLVLREAGILLAWGVGIGLTATFAVTSVLRAVLFNTGPRDPLVLTAVCAVVVLAGLLAAYLPAARAAAIDPMVALRSE